MGRNSAIKQYEATPPGQSMDLFADKDGRLPVVVELLRSPWVFRASELLKREDAAVGKRRDELVAVAWDERARCPSAFEWAGRTYRIDAAIQSWAVERYWWRPRSRVSRRYWRVLARGGTYDLAYDRIERIWVLVGIQD